MHIWANMSGTCISNMVEIDEGLVLFWFKGMAPMHAQRLSLFIAFYKVLGTCLLVVPKLSKIWSCNFLDIWANMSGTCISNMVEIDEG